MRERRRARPRQRRRARINPMYFATALTEIDRGLGRPDSAVLGASGYALAFAVLFAGVALAAHTPVSPAQPTPRCAASSRFFRPSLRATRSPDATADRQPSSARFTRHAGVSPLGGGGLRTDRARARPRDYRAGRQLYLCGDELFVAWAVGHDVLNYSWARTEQTRHPEGARHHRSTGLTPWPIGIGWRCASPAPYSASCCCSVASRFTRGNPA